MLPQKGIDEFKQLMKEKYGRELSNEEAAEQANRLVDFFELLLKFEYKRRYGKTKG